MVDENFHVIHRDNRARAQERAQKVVKECKEKVKASTSIVLPEDKIQAMTSCMELGVNKTIQVQQEEQQFQSQLRSTMADQLVQYACTDPQFNNTVEVLNRTWHWDNSEGGGHPRDFLIHVVHERPSSAIWHIPGFVSDQECTAIQKAMDPQTKTVGWNTLKETHAYALTLQSLTSKLYQFGKAALRLTTMNMEEDHPLLEYLEYDEAASAPAAPAAMECQDTTATTKEDDVCHVSASSTSSSSTNQKIKAVHWEDPQQLATLFLFCNVPTSLGAIHFPQANVHINPKKGMALLAVTRQPSHELDGFVQDYHLCPNYKVWTHTFYQQQG